VSSPENVIDGEIDFFGWGEVGSDEDIKSISALIASKSLTRSEQFLPLLSGFDTFCLGD